MTVKILVVDDELDLQDLMSRKFRREIRHGEFTFDFANDGVAALEKVEADEAIDLVISDINMPRMDGLTLLEHLSEFDDRLRTIVISAYGDMDNIRTAMNRGAFDFVTKPIDFQDLMITIKKSLDQLDIFKEAIEARMVAERSRANLARYVPPKLVDTLASRDKPFGPPRLQLVGALFADIRGFTSMSEAMEPEDVMQLLREYHTRMEAVVFEHDGTLDDYVGDAVFATFGVPEASALDATNALACARDMLATIHSWNAERAAHDEPPIGVGVGVHFGSAVMGDIGSERAMNFTVIGDTVNVAARLEGMTRDFDSDLIVSKALIEQVRQESNSKASELIVDFEESGEQEIRGRKKKVSIFVLGRQ
jgi:adenylate cyclase